MRYHVVGIADNAHLQVDGAPDNKCRAMFMYAEYLVRLGLFDVVMISFLIVGHTHNIVDQQFVALTFELRRGGMHAIIMEQQI